MPKVNTNLKPTKKWKIKKGMRCRHCKTQARVHPQTEQLWGCTNCGYSSWTLYTLFEKGKPRQET